MQKLTAAEVTARTPLIRRYIIDMLHKAGSGHPGGSLSACEMVCALYYRFLNHDPARPEDPDRDRFILSKGHAVPVQYAVMADCGYLAVAELDTLRCIDSRLQGHPVKGTLPGIEASTGALGQGLSIAVGHALAAKLDGKSYRTWCMVGDGEINEGQIWEAAMFAAHHRLDNLVCIVDANQIQLDGRTADILDTEPLPAKWQAFGWHTIEIDGHDMDAVYQAFQAACDHTGSPVCIVARTIKGKGVSFMENEVEWHGVTPNDAQAAAALAEIG